MSTPRQPRRIPSIAGGPDERATNLNNALYLIEEFVSPTRLATLASLPTRAQLIAAVDLYMTCEDNPDLLSLARALRAAAETWVDGKEVPASVYAAARGILSALGAEPPGGWDVDDGHYRPDAASEAESGPQPGPRLETSGRVAEVPSRAARAAQTVMYAMNLAALLASPRVLRKATEVPSREHLLEHLDGLLELLSTGSLSSPLVDNAATREAATRLRAACAKWPLGPEASTDMQRAARALLAAFGVPEPLNGWDNFEGILDA